MWLLFGDSRDEIRLRSTAMDPTVFGESSRADCSASKDGSPRGFLGISFLGGSSGRFAPSCGELESSMSVQTAWWDSDRFIRVITALRRSRRANLDNLKEAQRSKHAKQALAHREARTIKLRVRGCLDKHEAFHAGLFPRSTRLPLSQSPSLRPGTSSGRRDHPAERYPPPKTQIFARATNLCQTSRRLGGVVCDKLRAFGPSRVLPPALCCSCTSSI